MTTEQILQQVKREPRTLIYFGDNMAQFREVAEAIYPEYADRFMDQIDRRDRKTKYELVIRTFRGKFDGWNMENSLAFFHIHLKEGICENGRGTLIDATRAKGAVIL